VARNVKEVTGFSVTRLNPLFAAFSVDFKRGAMNLYLSYVIYLSSLGLMVCHHDGLHHSHELDPLECTCDYM
jgi:hypothetical protein